MSIPVECPECDTFVGDFGMTDTGTTTCPECGHETALEDHTFAGS